jgi:hypothetical protein
MESCVTDAMEGSRLLNVTRGFTSVIDVELVRMYVLAYSQGRGLVRA